MIARARLKLVTIMALFAAPIAASYIAFHFFRPEAKANYGELLAPPAMITTAQFLRAGGGEFRFQDLGGKWVLIAPTTLKGVDWPNSRLQVGLTRDAVKHSPSIESVAITPGEDGPPFIIM